MAGRSSDLATVHLPQDVIDRIERRLQYAKHETVDEYVAFVMRETLLRVEDQRDDEVNVDQTTVKRRLESLGYFDE